MLTGELAYESATNLAAAVRHRAVSPVEVVEYFLRRVEERDPSLNSVVYLADNALDQAKRAERAVTDGRRLGPLHGVPTALKDLFDFHPGWPSTLGGIRPLRNNLATQHCIYAERMKAAGAIVLGKTNSPVMGFRGTTDNPLFGPTRNPFDTRLNSGGSSGGSAAAVADGLLPLAEGTDGGGSIRIPSSWCGVVGFKPSFGRVPCITRPNAFGGAHPFLFEGAIARTVADVALAATVLTGYDARDPFALDEPVNYLSATEASLADLRVAYSSDLGIFPIEPDVAEVTARGAAVLSEAGATVDDVAVTMPAGHRELAELWCRMMTGPDILETLHSLGVDPLGEHAADLPAEYRAYLHASQGRTALDALHDEQQRSEVYDAVQKLFVDHDLVVTPTVASLPVPNNTDGNTLGPSSINGIDVNPLIGWCLTYPLNFSGHPAISVPAGVINNLPVGLQIIGPRYGDRHVLAAAAALEQLQPWQHNYTRCHARPLHP